MAGTTKNYTFNYQNKTKYGFASVFQQHLTQQVIDSISGVDAYYVPKESYDASSVDLIFQEAQRKDFHRIYKFRVYIADTSLFTEGENSMFSTFGLQLTSSLRLVFSQREFAERLGVVDIIDASQGISAYQEIDYTQWQPKPDDIFFLDQFDGKLFQVVTVDESNTIGSRFNKGTIWNCTCKLYEASTNDNIAVTTEATDDDDVIEFADLINGTVTNIESTDLTDSQVLSATDTGADVGTGVYGEDNLNDNYRKESNDTIRNTGKTNPFDEY